MHHGHDPAGHQGQQPLSCPVTNRPLCTFDTRASSPWLALACVQKPCLDFLSGISTETPTYGASAYTHTGQEIATVPFWGENGTVYEWQLGALADV